MPEPTAEGLTREDLERIIYALDRLPRGEWTLAVHVTRMKVAGYSPREIKAFTTPEPS